MALAEPLKEAEGPLLPEQGRARAPQRVVEPAQIGQGVRLARRVSDGMEDRQGPLVGGERFAAPPEVSEEGAALVQGDGLAPPVAGLAPQAERLRQEVESRQRPAFDGMNPGDLRQSGGRAPPVA